MDGENAWFAIIPWCVEQFFLVKNQTGCIVLPQFIVRDFKLDFNLVIFLLSAQLIGLALKPWKNSKGFWFRAWNMVFLAVKVLLQKLWCCVTLPKLTVYDIAGLLKIRKFKHWELIENQSEMMCKAVQYNCGTWLLSMWLLLFDKNFGWAVSDHDTFYFVWKDLHTHYLLYNGKTMYLLGAK